MHILITLRSYDRLGGVQTYTTALASKLLERGLDVSVLALRIGAPSNALAERGARIVRASADLVDGEVDVVHAQHRQTALIARALLPSTPMLIHAHGVVPPDEQPPSIDLDVRRWVAVSEEVAANLADRGVADEVLVARNPIDTDRFRPTSPPAARPRRALVLGRDLTGEAHATLAAACAACGIELRATGTRGAAWTERIEDELATADIVFALGRGALEAMACGRPTYVYGHFGADGWVDERTHGDLATHNFSGRRHARSLSVAALADEIRDGYDPGLGDAGRALVLSHHDLDSAVALMVEEYARAASGPPPAAAVPAAELRLLFDRITESFDADRMDEVLRASRLGTALRRTVHPDGRVRTTLSTLRGRIRRGHR